MHGLFTVRTAGELLWGYEDPLLQTLTKFLPEGMIPTSSVQLLQNMSDVSEAHKLQPTVVNTGARDIDQTGNVSGPGLGAYFSRSSSP